MKHFLKRLLLVALLCVPWVTQAQTDTLTVADGTTTNSYIPFYGIWMDANQHNQVLYPASMTASIVGDSITGMGFYMSSTSTNAWGSTVTIRLGISSNAVLTGLDNSTALTQVWQGTVNGQGDIWINFDNAYAFQGGNLLVDIQTSGTSYGSSTFYGISQDGASYYSYNSSGGVQGFIPKTSFLHVDGDFEVCLMPTNLVADYDSTQMTISWNPAAGVSGYNVYMNDSLVSESITDTFFVFDNLTSNTVYNVAVTSVCTDGESPSIGGTYRTDCGEMVIPFLANFDNDPYGEFPPCWTRVIQAGTDPSVNTVWSHSGSQSMYLQADHQYNMFASQAVPLAGNNIKVSFWAYLNSNYEGWIKAGVMTDRNDTSTFIPLMNITDMNSTWTNYEFSTHDLDANATYYVAFLYYGTYAYNYGSSAIDDISITTTDGCAMPRYAAIDALDTSFVSFHWVPGSSSNNNEIAYGTINDVDAANVISEITDTAYTINGLNPGTMYYFWVRNICTSGDTTLWYYVGKARTACSDGINAPYEENMDGYEYNDIPACWTVLQSTDNYGSTAPYMSGDYLYFYPEFNEPNLIVMPYIRLAANAMNIEVNGSVYSYYPTTFEVGYVTNPDSAETFVSLGSITATNATDYEFNTSSVEADSIWIAFRASTTSQYSYAYLYYVRVSALGSCVRPDYLALDTVSFDMAELHCNSTEADEYEVRYATVNNVNAETANSAVASDTVITLTNLTASTHYYTWVRSVCSDDDMSEWRQGPEFTTTCGEEFCMLQIVMHDSFGDGWNGNAINVYTNGVFQMSATIESGNSGTASHAMCEGDSVSLTWTLGSYPGEASFEILHAGVQIATGSGSSLSNGVVVATAIGCPSCMPVSIVEVVDGLTTDESITVTWTANSESDDEWAVTLNGQFVDVATTNSYTFYNLSSRTDYVIGVATLCGDNDTSDYVYINASTICSGINCSMAIVMHDSFGDGWNGHAIDVFLNGTQYATATITNGTDNSFNMDMCDGDTVVLKGVSGSYPGEVSFTITHANGVVYQGVGSNLNGDTLVVLTGCPSCVSPAEINISNITTTSASINWNTNILATEWHLTVNSATGMLVDTILTSVPFTVTGLQPSTGYTVMVSSVCGEDTAMATVTTFLTSCVDITLPWYFVAANDPSSMSETMPLCWYTPQVYATSYSTYPYNYNYYGAIYLYAYSGTPCMAATPRIPTAGNNVYVRFHAQSSIYNGGAATAGIMTDASNPATYIPLVDVNANDFTEFEFTTDAVTGLAATDTIYVAFQTTCATDGSYSYAELYLQDVYVQAIPNCQRPDSVVVTNITDNSVTLSWPNTGANSYTVFYGDTAVSVSGTTVTISGLNAGFTYNMDVQGNCTSDSSLLRHVTFTTMCTPIILPWSEGFESTPNYNAPNCWSFKNQYPDYNGNLSPFVYDYDYYAHTGDKSLEIVGTSANNTMAISPVLTGEAMNTLYISFWVYGSSSYGFEAGLMTDPNADSTFIPLLIVPSTDYNSTQYGFQTNSLTNNDSTFHFAIRYTSSSTYSGNIYIDDINVLRMPECSDEFVNAAISGITNDGATFSWTPGLGINANSTYTVTLMDANYGTVSTYTDVTSPMNLTGLTSSTEFNVAVSLTCGGSVTATSDTVNFTTLCNSLDVIYSYDSTMTADVSDYAPMGMSNWNYGYTQTIIDSAFMVEGDVVGFAFLPATANKGEYYTHMDVFMANVSESDLNSGWITPDDSAHVFTQVINDADMCYDTADWQQHIFTQPFTWDGHSNVLVTVRRSHGTYSYGASFSVHSNANTNGKTRYSYNDYNSYDINDPSAASTNGGCVDYVGDFKFLICGETCAAPVAYATVNDYQSATINWTCDADTVEYALKDATEPSYQLPSRVPNNGLAFAGNLDPATTYMFHIRAVCEEGEVSEWTEISFTTDSLPCFDPANLHTAGVSYTNAILAWDAGESQNQWSIHLWNTTVDTNIVVTANPYNVTGLTQTTDYFAAVKAICGNGAAESEYSDTIQFTTISCAQVTGVTVSNITANSAVINWTSTGADKYKIEYGDRNFGQGQGTVIVVENAATSYTLTDLIDDHDYSVFVKAVCVEGAEGEWSEQVDFTTLVGQGQGIDQLPTASSQLLIYPNPTKSATTIAVSGVNGEVSITVVDMNGRTLMSDSMSCEGDCTKRMEVSGLAQGAYFIRVNGENLNMVRKLIVK